jgi:hypothetical protein
MKALTLSVLGLAITAAVPVAAQTDTARSGQPKRIWTFFRLPDRPRRGRLRDGEQRFRRDAPDDTEPLRPSTTALLEAIYTSRAGFKGTDTVYLYYGRLNGDRSS